jgi:uncharacterized phage-associated protein
MKDKIGYFEYDENKASQVVAYFLKLSGNEMNYNKLIKLIYIADRRMLKKYGMVLVGGKYFALPYGPINASLLDDIHNLKRKNIINLFYNSFEIKASNKNIIILKNDPGEDYLSKINKKMIENLSSEFISKNFDEMITYCHKYCEEWKDPQNSSKEILIENIVKNANQELIDQINLGIFINRVDLARRF